MESLSKRPGESKDRMVMKPQERFPLTVALVAPFPPPWDGMSVQAERFHAGLIQEGIQVVTVRTLPPFPAKFRWIDELRVIRSAVQFCRLVWNLLRLVPKVTLLHIFSCDCMSFFFMTAPSILVGRFYRKRVVVHYHGGEAEQFFERWGWLAKPILSFADRVVVPSFFLERIFHNIGFHADIVPNLLRLDQIHFRQRGPVQPICISTRHLENDYNPSCVIRAFWEIAQRYLEAQLWMAGKGYLRTELEEQVHHLGLTERVRFLGQVPNEKLAEFFDRADIFLNASHVDNQPVAILEAFAAGLPVVSTRAGGIPDMVEHGYTGLLVPLDDSRAMAGAILELLRDPVLCRRLSRNGGKIAERYTWSFSKGLLLDVYKEVGGSHSKLSQLSHVEPGAMKPLVER